ncbi:hypothetical protein SAMN05444166_7111 [Singulisphaera sp. GP187]|uniref:hypothetical protein n=1 Tax=Singulisphaera sp. GP187 TaxID=1882752 RepID=UPI000929629E|nr:hypothetical protein [Singulisphaera sp. GP187]SIO62656.1 hypothetical protein SAMN05444166_7111 [Singulisphaera sp. GP187]
MDSNALVEFQIDAGQRLIRQLVQDEFEVRAAFWVKTTEEGLWFLYISTPLIEQRGLAEAYRGLQASLQRLQGIPLSLSDIKLIGGTNPITRDVLSILSRHPSRLALRYGGKQLGSMTIEEAYVYPEHFYEIGDRRQMTKEDVLRELVSLMNRGPGILHPSKIALRNGDTFQGLPFSIQLGSNQRSVIQFVADGEFAPRIVDVDDIASIE